MSDREHQNGELHQDGDPGIEAGPTRAEMMGIAPNLPRVKGDGRDIRKQLRAAEEAVEKARAEASEARDNHLRLAAEMENVRRRHRQEQMERSQYANEQLIARLLPLLDNFHRALEHEPELVRADTAGDQWAGGLRMIVKQFEDILAAEGVEVLEAVGQPFDPAFHQAVASEPSELPEGIVTAELQRGYRLRDRVLRPSMVRISAGS